MATSKRRASKTPGQLKKIKKPNPGTSPEEIHAFYRSTLALIQDLRDGSRLIKTMFMRLPSKKLYPDYFERISQPISLYEITQKVQKHSYNDTQEFLEDFKIMADNASDYNLKESVIAIDAYNIYKFVLDQVNQFNQAPMSSPTLSITPTPLPTPAPKIKFKLQKKDDEVLQDSESENLLERTITSELKTKLQNVLENLADFKEGEDPIGEVFLDEPSRKDYPDYYAIIKKPISINTITKHLLGKKSPKYSKVSHLVNDVNLMWKNAQTYNEEESLIFHFSKVLSEFFSKKIGELANELGLEVPGITKSKKKLSHRKSSVGTGQGLKVKLPRPASKTITPEPKAHSPIIKKADTPEPDNTILTEPITESLLESEDEKIGKLRKIKDGKDALIRNISIISFRSKGPRNHYNLGNSEQQLANMVFQNWFEYDFDSSDYKINNYSFNLPVLNNVTNKGSITIYVTLRDDLVEKRYESFLSVNEDRVKPTPFSTYADSEKVLTTRYDLKLAMGLNNIKFGARVLKDNVISGGIDSTNILTDKDIGMLPEEIINFWVNVCQ